MVRLVEGKWAKVVETTISQAPHSGFSWARCYSQGCVFTSTLNHHSMPMRQILCLMPLLQMRMPRHRLSDMFKIKSSSEVKFKPSGFDITSDILVKCDAGMNWSRSMGIEKNEQN